MKRYPLQLNFLKHPHILMKVIWDINMHKNEIKLWEYFSLMLRVSPRFKCDHRDALFIKLVKRE